MQMVRRKVREDKVKVDGRLSCTEQRRNVRYRREMDGCGDAAEKLESG